MNYLARKHQVFCSHTNLPEFDIKNIVIIMILHIASPINEVQTAQIFVLFEGRTLHMCFRSLEIVAFAIIYSINMF